MTEWSPENTCGGPGVSIMTIRFRDTANPNVIEWQEKIGDSWSEVRTIDQAKPRWPWQKRNTLNAAEELVWFIRWMPDFSTVNWITT